MRCACSCSRSGSSATSASSSPITSRVTAGREVGPDRQLGCLQAQLLQPPDLGGRERLVGQVGQDFAAPQRERLPRLAVGGLVGRAAAFTSRSKRAAST